MQQIVKWHFIYKNLFDTLSHLACEPHREQNSSSSLLPYADPQLFAMFAVILNKVDLCLFWRPVVQLYWVREFHLERQQPGIFKKM